MATKNIVPRANGEGGIGTSVKRWLSGFFKNINVDTEAIVPTPANNDNSTKAATTAWVENVFFTKLVAKLLATTAATISSLSTSSLFYRFLAQALSVAGVQYNLSNSSAWYICLGSLFGGLIIQGGKGSATVTGNELIDVQLPIAFNNGGLYCGSLLTVTAINACFVTSYVASRTTATLRIAQSSYSSVPYWYFTFGV